MQIHHVKKKMWIPLFAVWVLLTIGARYWPYFPCDVPLTRLVQSASPANMGWAESLSLTAKFPWSLILLAVSVGLAWRLAGWRSAALAVVAFVGMWVLGKWLGPLIARPRPPSDLVYVPERLSGYSYPSIFALVYASTVGFLAMLFCVKASGAHRIIPVFICSVVLLVGGAARVALGAHWPSDVLLSYLVSLLWSCFLIRFT